MPAGRTHCHVDGQPVLPPVASPCECNPHELPPAVSKAEFQALSPCDFPSSGDCLEQHAWLARLLTWSSQQVVQPEQARHGLPVFDRFCHSQELAALALPASLDPPPLPSDVPWPLWLS